MTTTRLSAGAAVVRFDAARPRFLLLRAFRYRDFPKGLADIGENPLATAQREVREETAIADPVFRWRDVHCNTPPCAGGKVARYVVAQSPADPVHLYPRPELGRPEAQAGLCSIHCFDGIGCRVLDCHLRRPLPRASAGSPR